MSVVVEYLLDYLLSGIDRMLLLDVTAGINFKQVASFLFQIIAVHLTVNYFRNFQTYS